ncbi:HLA class I histocompatibility antigen alpha chain family protein [Actinacidiphila glaucinigra]|uniref:hypothetical protein n=1 Tax=Actinacidiphila glaucinigra TaxID=235986 RepID=UPI002E34FA59|nr:hypothetical protein [Actinacidiphila glaucinigra]
MEETTAAGQLTPTTDENGYSATVIHIDLPLGHWIARQHPKRPTHVLLERAEVPMVVIVLNADPGGAGPVALAETFGWPMWRDTMWRCPMWQYPRRLEFGEGWYAIFDTKIHTLEGVYNQSSEFSHKIPFAFGCEVQVSDQMWETLEIAQHVLLCAGLSSDPSGPELSGAIREGRMRAVFAHVLLD